jgi:ABC-type branched-subunit amino acid transport system substrate-binding protein
MKKSILLLSLLLSLALVVHGMVRASAAQMKELRIGHINPLTGPVAPWGLPIGRGLDCLAEYFSEQGGVKIGRDAYRIVLYHEDDKFSGEIGRAAAEKLISKEKVKAIIGSITAETMLGIKTVANREKIFLMLGSTGGEEKILGPDWPYIFQVSQTQPQKLLVLDIALKTIGSEKIKKVVALGINSACTRGERDVLVNEKAPQYGFEVVGKTFHPPGTTDYYPLVTPLMEGKPDLADLSCSGPGDCAVMMKTFHELGYKGYYITVGSLVNVKYLMKIAGIDAVQGYVAPYESMDCPAIKPEQRKIMKIIKDKWEQKWPNDPFEPIAWRYATILQILMQAYEKAGTLNADAVKKTLEEGKFETILGDCRFTGKKRYGIAHVSNLITIAGIIQGQEVKYLGYDRLTHE